MQTQVVLGHEPDPKKRENRPEVIHVPGGIAMYRLADYYDDGEVKLADVFETSSGVPGACQVFVFTEDGNAYIVKPPKESMPASIEDTSLSKSKRRRVLIPISLDQEIVVGQEWECKTTDGRAVSGLNGLHVVEVVVEDNLYFDEESMAHITGLNYFPAVATLEVELELAVGREAVLPAPR